MISVIICTYNRDKYIYNTLKAVAENGLPTDEYEIILVNNNSTDRTEEFCKLFQKDYPDIPYHYFMEENQGLSYARNRGIKQAHGDILLFLDDDAIIQENYFYNLKRHLKNYPYIMAFGGKIIPVFETGITPKWYSKWTMSCVSTFDKGKKVNFFKGNSYPIGANMGVKAECIAHVALFDTELGRKKESLAGGEEKDFFLRMKKLNYPILYCPDVVVEHIIPERRTTNEYVKNLAMGIGKSEKVRCYSQGRVSVIKRYISELIKWGGALAIASFYFITGRFSVAKMVIKFRFYITKGLIE